MCMFFREDAAAQWSSLTLCPNIENQSERRFVMICSTMRLQRKKKKFLLLMKKQRRM